MPSATAQDSTSDTAATDAAQQLIVESPRRRLGRKPRKDAVGASQVVDCKFLRSVCSSERFENNRNRSLLHRIASHRTASRSFTASPESSATAFVRDRSRNAQHATLSSTSSLTHSPARIVVANAMGSSSPASRNRNKRLSLQIDVDGTIMSAPSSNSSSSSASSSASSGYLRSAIVPATTTTGGVRTSPPSPSPSTPPAAAATTTTTTTSASSAASPSSQSQSAIKRLKSPNELGVSERIRRDREDKPLHISAELREQSM
jgi:hypothetical protein